MKWRTCIAVGLVSVIAVSCDREERGYRVRPPEAKTISTLKLSDLHPGTTRPSSTRPSTQPASSAGVKNRYEDNAYHLAEGKRFYAYYNCKGCHADGGGDIGPPLMDDRWIYGSESEQVFATIVQGRPNGMPSFQGRIPDYQVWQIVAYVRSLSGLVRQDAAPGRGDHMQVKKPENSKDAERPKKSGTPKSAEMPQ
jgi:cytochrome c oxidase cbb3-type subunit III